MEESKEIVPLTLCHQKRLLRSAGLPLSVFLPKISQVVVAQTALESVEAVYVEPGGSAPLFEGSGLAATLAATSPIFPPLGLVIVLLIVSPALKYMPKVVPVYVVLGAT